MPALFFQEGIINSTTEVAQSVTLQGDNNLEEVSSSNLIFIINFEVTLYVNCWKVLNALFNIRRSIAI